MSDPLRNPGGAGVLDEDSINGAAVVAEYHIRVHASGALSVIGPIEEKEWTIAVFENAKDAVRNHHARRAGGLIIPGKDVDVPSLKRIE